VLDYTINAETDGFFDDSVHDDEWTEGRMDVDEWTGDEDLY